MNEDTAPNPDVVDVPDETPIEQVETTVDTPIETVEDAPVEEQVTEPVEEEDTYSPVDIPDLPPLDFNKLPVGEDGLIDPNALAQAINQQTQAAVQTAVAQARAEAQEQMREQKLWEKTVSKYPELSTNKELRDLVHKSRVGSIIEGKNPTPLEVADSLFKHIGIARKDGAKSATESVKVQKSAYVEQTTSNAAPQSRQQVLMEKMVSSNREEADAARRELLKIGLFGDDN